MSRIAEGPFAYGLVVHIEPHRGHWRARVWRDGDEIAQVVERSPSDMLVGLGRILGSIFLAIAGQAAMQSTTEQLQEMIGIGRCTRCGNVGPIGIAPCPCMFGPGNPN